MFSCEIILSGAKWSWLCAMTVLKWPVNTFLIVWILIVHSNFMKSFFLHFVHYFLMSERNKNKSLKWTTVIYIYTIHSKLSPVLRKILRSKIVSNFESDKVCRLSVFLILPTKIAVTGFTHFRGLKKSYYFMNFFDRFIL